MKKEKGPKFRWGLCVIVCLVTLFNRGCGDTQSNERMKVHGLSVHLFRRPEQAYSSFPDKWAVSGDTQGRDICGVAHGFVIELLDEHNERLYEAAVRIDIEVVDHWSILSFRDL